MLNRVLIAIGIASIAALLFFWRPNWQRNVPPPDASNVATEPAKVALPKATEQPASDFAAEALARTVEAFSTHPTRDEALELISKLESSLATKPKADVVSALIALLAGGKDVPTGLQFVVGANGYLIEQPTIRTWALDYLTKLDLAAALSFGAKIYGEFKSPDEWALALRNDFRAGSAIDGGAALRQRVTELVSHSPWRESPSAGFLEAFDIAVATQSWELLPSFEDALDPKSNQATRRGALVAIDRFSVESPEDFLPQLARNVAWLSTEPLLRASVIARADPASARQLSAAETYLARKDVSDEEGRRFFELFPNANAFVSHNLTTPIRTKSLANIAALDRAALSAVKDWQIRPEFSRWQSAMQAATGRLSEQVSAAQRGGY